MANLKEIRIRLASIMSTRQITSAMKMVSAAKLRKAQDEVTRLRPFANKLNDILSALCSNPEVLEDNTYAQPRIEHNILIVLITSNRGLCGAFNTNVIKKSIAIAEEKYSDQLKKGNVEFYAIGKKGRDFLTKKGYKVAESNISIFDKVTYEGVSEIVQKIMHSFVTKKYDKVELVYNQFRNAASQDLTNIIYLPVPPSDQKSTNQDYIFEPSKQEIVADLIPRALKTIFYKALLDSVASEHGARMTSMHKATDNAEALTRDLRLQYNKERQASITKEILEVVGGAEALNG